MAIGQCLDLIHQWRRCGFDWQHPKLGRLSYIEGKITDFLTNSEGAEERSWLVGLVSGERYDQVARRILRPDAPNASIQYIESVRERLAGLDEKLKANASEKEVKDAFHALPKEVRELFHWAIWVDDGALFKHGQLGEIKFNDHPFLLNEIQTPLLHLKGKNLCEQMIQHYEMLYLLDKQKTIVQLLQKEGSMNDPRMKEQIALLQNLEKMKEVEDFDRLTLLYKRLSRPQWQAVLHPVSEKVRELLSTLETFAHKKQKVRCDAHHLYQWRGAHPKLDGTQFQLFAPSARQVKLILTAYGKEEHCIPMQRNHFGVFETHTHHAGPGRTYRYLIEDCHGNWNTRIDPFSFSVTQTGDLVETVVTDIDTYRWNDHDWMRDRACQDPCKKPLSIYELHVDSWKKEWGKPLSFRNLASAIVDYQKKVPFTHVQLYGVLDNKNDFSWGYQVDNFFATNRRLGNAEDFMFLVDFCHQHGIGVIVDWIPAHYKHEHCGDRSQGMYEYDGSNLFGDENSYWGTKFFDFNKEETRRFLLGNALYWFEKMHVDGLRVDAVGPMMRPHGREDWAAMEFLKKLNNVVHEQYPAIMIAEEAEGYSHVTRSTCDGGLGFDVKIGIPMQSQMRNYFRTSYDQRGKDEHHHGKLLSSLNEHKHGERWMLAHSHDDAAGGSPPRHSTIYGSLPTDDAWRKFADMRLFHAWNLLTPGFGHAIHMGDEIGQRWPWNERLHMGEGAVEWHLLGEHPDGSYHRGLQECVGDLNRFYRSRPAFWKQGGRGFQLISEYAPNQMIGMHRFDYEGQRIALFFNFSPQGYQQYDFPLSPLSEDPDLRYIRGANEVFNTDGKQYGGTAQFGNQWAWIKRDEHGNPTHFSFAFPPLSLVAFEEVWG